VFYIDILLMKTIFIKQKKKHYSNGKKKQENYRVDIIIFPYRSIRRLLLVQKCCWEFLNMHKFWCCNRKWHHLSSAKILSNSTKKLFFFIFIVATINGNKFYSNQMTKNLITNFDLNNHKLGRNQNFFEIFSSRLRKFMYSINI
jgi:hypothetical protein